MPPQQKNYDFIMNPQKPKGPNFAGPQKILMIVLLFGGVAVLLIILFSVIFSGGGNNRDSLVQVRATQAELERVIELGIDDVVDVTLRQQFQTLLTASISDDQAVASLLSARGVTVEPIELQSARNSEVDGALEDAKDKNDFDPAYETAVANAGGNYLQALQNAQSSAVSDREATLLSVAVLNVQTVANAPSQSN